MSASDNERGRAQRSSRGWALYSPGRGEGGGGGGAALLSRGSYSKFSNAGQEGATPAVRVVGAGSGGAGPGARHRAVAEKGAPLPCAAQCDPRARARPSPAPRRLVPPPAHAAAKAAEPVPGPPLCPAWGGAGGGGGPGPPLPWVCSTGLSLAGGLSPSGYRERVLGRDVLHQRSAGLPSVPAGPEPWEKHDLWKPRRGHTSRIRG